MGPVDVFALTGPGNLDLARQSAQERADALGIEVRIVDERGGVVDVAYPPGKQAPRRCTCRNHRDGESVPVEETVYCTCQDCACHDVEEWRR